MIIKTNITLLGLPGAGKTYWGQKLADRLNCTFYDLDKIIEGATQMPVAQIFAQEGEDVFRKLEHEYLQELLFNTNSNYIVLAVGGGTPAYYNNMEIINKYTTSLFLNTSINAIIANLRNEQSSHRPLFNKVDEANLTNLLHNLLNERKLYYNKAQFVINQADINLQNIINTIKNE